MATSTTSELIYKLRSTLQQKADDSGISNRLLYAFIKTSRAHLIKQEIDKKRLYKSLEFQSINCFPLEASSLETCCGVNLPAILYKSKIRLPDIIDSNSGLALQGVFAIDGSQRIHTGTINDVIRKAKAKYSSGQGQVFFDNGYLYLYGISADAVRISAIFENPEEVDYLNHCTTPSGECDLNLPICINYLDSPFPYPKYLEEFITQEALSNLLATYFKLQPDRSNDSESN